MPEIVNAYHPLDNSIANSLASLGNSMWGPQAATAGYVRAKTMSTMRDNAARQELQTLAAHGGVNMNDPNAQAALFGMTDPQAGLNAYRGVTIATKGVQDPASAAAFEAAGGAYGSTYQGMQDQNDKAFQIAKMQTDRANALAMTKYNSEFQTMMDPTGHPVLVPRSGVSAATAQGYSAPVTLDQVKANIIQNHPATPGATPAAASGWPSAPVAPFQTTPTVAPAPQAPMTQAPPPAAPSPASVSTDPMYNRSPSDLAMLGMNKQPINLVDLVGHRRGISYDGGRSAVDQATGAVEPVAGNNWTISGPETSVTAARDELAKSAAAAPLQMSPDWQNSAYAQAAQMGAGVVPYAQEKLNAILGTFGIPQAMAPGGEIGGSFERARSVVDLMNQRIVQALHSTPRYAKYNVQQILAMLPQEGMIGNNVTEMKKLGPVFQALADQDKVYQSQIANPAMTGDALSKLTTQLSQNRAVLNLLMTPPHGGQTGAALTGVTAPPQAGAPPVAPAPTAAPAPVAPAPVAPAAPAVLKYDAQGNRVQ